MGESIFRILSCLNSCFCLRGLPFGGIYFHISIYIYIYIQIRRPPLGGHQAAKSMLQTACPKSFQSFKSQVDSQVFHSFPPPICNCRFASLVSAFSCLQVSNLGFADLFSRATEWRVCLNWVCTLNLGSPRVPLKNHQISSLSPRPSKIRKSAPRVTKRHQNVT